MPDFRFDASRVLLMKELPVLDDDEASDDSTETWESQHAAEYEKLAPATFPQQWVDWPADLADALGSMDSGSVDSGSVESGSESSDVASCEAMPPRRPLEGRRAARAVDVDEVTDEYFADAEMAEA